MISLLSVPHSRKAAYSVPMTLKTWSLLEVINVYFYLCAGNHIGGKV
jgi:hypothetical protein